MPQVKPGKTYIGGEVPEDLARRFQEDCKAQDRSVSSGLRRLLKSYFDGPETHEGAATNGASVESSTIAHGTGDHVVQQAY